MRRRVALLGQERDAASHELGIAKGRMREEEGKFEVLRKKAEQEAQGDAETLEVRDAFGERGLEEWAPFPGKRIFQVTPSDQFDGRISSEFRQKDEGTDEKGVSLLMGRSAALGTSEVQCILFDPKHLSDVQAARWWERNRRRFEQRAEQARLLAADPVALAWLADSPPLNEVRRCGSRIGKAVKKRSFFGAAERP